MNLRDLDEQVIPGLARRTQAAADRLRRTRAAAAAQVERVRPTRAPRTPGPARMILRLRALDARYTRGGPLALLRDVPQLGGFLVAVLILANGATVAQRADRRQEIVAESPDGASIVPGFVEGGTVGPEIGDDVPGYVQKADRELQERLADDAAERPSAMVAFTEYRTPADALALLGEVPGFRVFFRVPGNLETEVHDEIVGKRFVRDTMTAYVTVAAQRRADIPNLLGEAKDADPLQKAFNELTARQFAQEAEQLERGCACVFAVAVIDDVAALFELRQTTGVRVVDLAPAGARLDTVTFTGLRPEEKVTVTNGNQKPDDALIVPNG